MPSVMFGSTPIAGFDWDRGNRDKCRKHGVARSDIEAVLRPDSGSLFFPDARHSGQEARFIAVGKTQAGRGVFVAFTLRHRDGDTLIRPISARYMHREEVEAYEKEIARFGHR